MSIVWRPSDTSRAKPDDPDNPIFRPDLLKTVEDAIGQLSQELRSLSLDIHSTVHSLLSIATSSIYFEVILSLGSTSSEEFRPLFY